MKNKGFLLVFCITFSLLFSSFSPTLHNSLSAPSDCYSDLETNSDLISQTPILIYFDEPSSWLPYANGSGTPSDPYVIENYNITHDPSYGYDAIAITIGYTTKNFILRNIFVKGFSNGIHVSDCSASGIVFENLTILATRNTAINIGSTNNYTVRDCIFSDARRGIYTSGDYVSIENCNFSYCQSYGLDLAGPDYNNVTRCEFFGNLLGIHCHYAKDNKIYENIIRDSTYYGLKFKDSTSDNLVYRNDFVRNNLEGTSQAYDDGESNLFYHPKLLEGNYWLGHKRGKYLIDGLAGSSDPFTHSGPVIMTIEYSGGGVPYSISSIVIAFGLLMLFRLIFRRKQV